MRSARTRPRARPGGGRSATGRSEHPLAPPISDTEIKPQHLMAEIDRLSGGEAIVASDVGQHQMWAAQLIRFNEPRLWINSGGLGSMGFGLPAAIGAQFARPDKLVFAIVRRRRIPDVDSGAGDHRQPRAADQDHRHEQRLPGHGAAVAGAVLQQPAELGELDCFPDAEKLAGAYGFKGRTVEKPQELAAALEEAVREPGPYLLNVRVTPFENVYPMVPAGGAINEMVLGPPQPVAVP